MKSPPLIVILGATACGKTSLASNLAVESNAEIISADSRQVYSSMDIGTGKDLNEYTVNGVQIPYHLIDIRSAGDSYNVFEFQQDFIASYKDIVKRKKLAILCGGSGLYIQAALAKEQMLKVPENPQLRKELAELSQEELKDKLITLKPEQHNTTDLYDRKRSIRAIEIAIFENENSTIKKNGFTDEYIIFGLKSDRKLLRQRIKYRLDQRLEEGMIKEVRGLLKMGVEPEQLNYYGLEYRFINLFLQGDISYQEMYDQLLQAIRRFAKKQETWFRRMERQGFKIQWMDVEMNLEEKLSFIRQAIHSHGT